MYTGNAFQMVFDRATTINWNKRPVVAQSITRSNVVRSVNRGGDTWRFEVTLPDGIPWNQLRESIEQMEYLDRHTSQTIQINNPGYNDWLTNYQGDATSISGMRVTSDSTNELVITSYGSTSGLIAGDKTFRAGDIIQLENAHVYSVVQDVIFPASRIVVNRPVIDSDSNYILIIGPEVRWDLLCISFPQWTIIQRDQVAWDGPFIFYEDV